MNNSNKYWAFISYSHRDKGWGDWLHKSLERYKVPKKLVGQMGRDGAIPKRVFPVFRDREELPTSADLGSNIEAALQQSRFLIVICSPNAAKSIWVNQEIKTFKRLGKADSILCLIVDGEPNATDQPGSADDECFPQAIRFEVSPQGEVTNTRAEPIAADVRPEGDGKDNAKLKLLAGLLGVNFDDLKQRDQRRRRKQKLLLALGTLLVAVAIAATAFLFEQQSLKREFEQTNFALNVAQAELDKGRLSAGMLLAHHATIKARALSLGKISSWVEQSLEVPISGRADTKRRLMVASQALLTQAFYAHPRQLWWRSGQASAVEQAKAPANTERDNSQLLDWLQLSAENVRQLNWSRDGLKVAIAHNENTVTIAEPLTKRRQDIEVVKQPGSIIAFEFSDNGRYLLARFERPGLWLVDLEQQSGINLSGQSEIEMAAFRPNSSELVISIGDAVSILDLDSDAAAVIKTEQAITAMRFDATGRYLTVQSADGHGLVAMAGESSQQKLRGPTRRLKQLTFSNDGKWLASIDGAQKPRLQIWDAQSGALVTEIDLPSSRLRRMSFTADDQILALQTGSSVRLWRRVTGELVHRFAPRIGELRGHRLNPGGGSLVLWSDHHHLELWSMESGQLITTLEGHSAAVTSAAFSADGQQLVSAAEDGTVNVWRLPSGELTWSNQHADTYAVHAVFNPAGTTIATRARDKAAYLWKLNSGEALQMTGHEHEYGAVQFSQDDAILLTTDYPDFSSSTRKLAVRIWDTATGELIQTLPDHWNFGAPNAQFLPMENRVITRSDAVRIFMPRSGKLVATFDTNAYAVDPSGQRIALLQGDEGRIMSIRPANGSLDDAIKAITPLQLSDSDLEHYFPETPPLLGY
ncbi:MAG: TIR domain-containing protein [Gammaproteobacteria bacterium]|nr:TIR domain-containing protein [Gammaproteobacteria bacterium]